MSIQQPSPKVEVREFFAESAGWDEVQWAAFDIQARRDASMAQVRAKEQQREAARRKAEIFVGLLEAGQAGETRAVEVVHHEGQVTRYDLVITPDGTHVKRPWLAGWYPWDKCHKAAPLKNGFTIHAAADALEAQG